MRCSAHRLLKHSTDHRSITLTHEQDSRIRRMWEWEIIRPTAVLAQPRMVEVIRRAVATTVTITTSISITALRKPPMVTAAIMVLGILTEATTTVLVADREHLLGS